MVSLAGTGHGGNRQWPKMPSKNVQPKQPKARVLRERRKREPQVHEHAKSALIVKGRKTSQDVSDALKDLVSCCSCMACPSLHTY